MRMCVKYIEGVHVASSIHKHIDVESVHVSGVAAFAVVFKFGIIELKDLSDSAVSQMLLYVTVDTHTWAKVGSRMP